MAIKSSLWLEVKYANLLSPKLERFKIKTTNPFLANLRCPICGDSAKNKTKTRGYIHESKGQLKYTCHNDSSCSSRFSYFLYRIDPSLHNEYVFECVKENGEPKPVGKPLLNLTKPKFSKAEQLRELKKVSQLPMGHGALKYLNARQIPSQAHYRLYHCPKFAHWVNGFMPNKFDERALKYDEPRLIIPFADQDGKLFGLQGRSYKKDASLRYITIMLDEDKPKIFGLDTVDLSREFVVVEGPLDALFCKNALAMAGADFSSVDLPMENAIVCFDNEPRNLEIVKRMNKTIEQGHRIVIWPEEMIGKDINDFIMGGMHPDRLQDIIYNNSHSGLSALNRLMEWKKVSF